MQDNITEKEYTFDRVYLNRERLNQQFQHILQENLALVVAGTGYGKTISALRFLEQASVQSIWVSLSEADNLPSRFWEEICHVTASVNQELSDHLRAMGFPTTLQQYNQLLALLNTKRKYAGQTVLVFDDFHRITNPDIYRVIEIITSSRPEHLCILLLSRQVVNFSPAIQTRLFVSNIQQNDLKFTQKELGAYFDLYGVAYQEDSLQHVWEYIDGWPLAAYLITLSYQSLDEIPNTTDFLTQLKLDEIFQRRIFTRYSPEQQTVLIKLALLEYFPNDLLHAIVEERSGEFLQQSEHNLFIQYNSRLCAYTFHNLFRNFLLTKKSQLAQNEIHQIYRIAARWSMENSMTIDAIRYYRYCEDYASIWQIIQNYNLDCTPEMARFFLETLNEFPAMFIQEVPLVTIILGRLLLINGDSDRAETLLSEWVKQWETSNTSEAKAMAGEACLMLGLIAMYQQRLDFPSWFQRAADCLPNGSLCFSKENYINEGNYGLMITSPEPGTADQFENAMLCGFPYASKAMNGCGAGAEYYVKAEIAYYRNQLDSATENAYRTIYLAKQQSQNDLVCVSYYILLRVYIVSGDFQNIAEVLREVKEYIARERHHYCDEVLLECIEGWFYSRVGQTDRIPSWMMDSSTNRISRSPTSDGRFRLVRAYALLEKRDFPTLMPYLDSLQNFFQARPILPAQQEVALLFASAYLLLGQTGDALHFFNKAYDLAAGNDLTMLFLEYGHYTHGLIDLARKEGDGHIPEEWMSSIYYRASAYSKRLNFLKTKWAESEIPAHPGTELFTQREQSILSLLSQGLTREEIAEELDTSLHVVKSCVKTIYDKLGAVNRADAIRIATDLGIIDGKSTFSY